MPSALDLSQAILPELIDIRRDLHRHPETAFEEVRTGGLVADFCERLGLSVRRNVAKTGVIATLNPDASRPALALRADMDALPIQEESDIPYRSENPGKGHLCGHDTHTTMLLGAAKILASLKAKIPFPIRFIFQPAEEIPRGGAELLIEEGLFSGIDEIFGLHINPLIPVGTLGLHSGPVMASMDKFEIDVHGVGGHGAMPHLTRDPVLAAAEIITSLQGIVARRVDPLESAVVSVCQINAGCAFNVIPSNVSIVGTARSLSPVMRENLARWIEQIACGVAQAHNQSVDVRYTRGTPVLANRDECVTKMAQSFRALGGSVMDIKPTMGGEDFAFYTERVPGCFGFLGAGDGTPATAHCFHNPRFNIDEKALAWGSALFVQLVCEKASFAL
ncbi:MAG TPA: amidohydrolase [Planctomycetota bacterium]|jgi:amidohydrolase